MNTPAKTITFLTTEYTQAALSEMSDENLLELRNLVATNLGAASIRAFKDHDTAVEQTWKALEKFESTSAAENGEAGSVEKPIKVKKEKVPKEPKERKPAKSSGPGIVKRPTRKMFSTIEKTGEHNGSTHGRAHRWPNYKNGMTIVDVIEGDGTEPWDVYNWEKQGILKVTEPTDEEYASLRAAWYKKHNLTDPETTKAQKAKEAAEKKAAAEAEKAKVAAEKAAAKPVEA
jgi:hypothetical protein